MLAVTLVSLKHVSDVRDRLRRSILKVHSVQSSDSIYL